MDLSGGGSISVAGANNSFSITLQNDAAFPDPTSYYGTGPDGSRAWYSLADGFSVTADLTKEVDGTTGVTTYGLADLANSGAGTLLAITRDAKGRVLGTRAATITGTAGQINVANGTAAAGLPTISLSDLANSGTGTAVYKTTRDSKGRISGQVAATTDDLPQGSTNKYFPEAPTDGYPYVRVSGTWEQTNSPTARYWLIEYPLLTDQAGNQLTDQTGRLLIANSPVIPPGWPTTTVATVATTSTLTAMTLAEANALANPQDFQMVAIVDLAGGREPCWYDASVSAGTKWRRFSDRSIAS